YGSWHPRTDRGRAASALRSDDPRAATPSSRAANAAIPEQPASTWRRPYTGDPQPLYSRRSPRFFRAPGPRRSRASARPGQRTTETDRCCRPDAGDVGLGFATSSTVAARSSPLSSDIEPLRTDQTGLYALWGR